VVIERLGKFQRVMDAGIHVRIPFIDYAAAVMSLQIQQLDASITVKSSDDVFVELPVTVQYHVDPGSVYEASYKIEKPTKYIKSVVLNVIKVAAAGMTLQDMFESRDNLRQVVVDTLGEKMASCGYVIDEVVVDNPEVSEELEVSFNSVTAAKRAQEAARMEAEAAKIREVGIAEAQGEAAVIMATKAAEARKVYATGNAEAITNMVGNTGIPPERALDALLTSDRNDTVRDAARSGATVVIATPNPGQDGLYAALPPQRQPANGTDRDEVAA
jgi:regulator of protease activity HflC (stomatin/prohibitin superfamily)